jgi:hypothetical protein
VKAIATFKKHDFLSWLNHFLTIARRAYGEFERRTGQVKAPCEAKAWQLAGRI